jgi:hypothetical protein
VVAELTDLSLKGLWGEERLGDYRSSGLTFLVRWLLATCYTIPKYVPWQERGKCELEKIDN